MKPFWQNLFTKNKKEIQIHTDERARTLKALYKKVTDMYGKDKFIFKAPGLKPSSFRRTALALT